MNNNTATMQPTIEELRKQGYKVKVMHGIVEQSDPHYNLSHRVTTIKLRDLKGNEHTASAKCSKKDSYSRKLGNKIALGRVLKSMENFYCNQQ